MSLPYDDEYFKNTLFLVLNNRCVAILFAAAMIHRNAESSAAAAAPCSYETKIRNESFMKEFSTQA